MEKRMRSFFVCLAITAAVFRAAAFNTAVTVVPALDTHAISPAIYGSNQNFSGTENFSAMRQGGNRLTGYNWENNASNAGTDWYNSSDNLIPASMGIPNNQSLIPGIGMTAFIDSCRKYNRFCLTTFQMAGFVARDKNGTVADSQVAPSIRWRYVFPHKPAAFAATPDTTDSAVYMDELMNFLKTKYTSLTDGWLGGIDLDNEPALWPSTHPLIHPAAPTCVELLGKSAALATAIKNVDTRPLIFGPVTYGFNEMYSFQNASDWSSVQGTYAWFVDYYLDQMRLASASAGRRLLDVFDIHWYSEAQGTDRITDTMNHATRANAQARIQAPRTLWDPNYRENSWIAQYFPSFLPLIPRIKTSIDAYYAGTKIGISEYSYGGDEHISGGLATADALGIYGKYGVFYASYWQTMDTTRYISAAFKLYRNYNGVNGTFGALSVRAGTNDSVRSSAYASIVSAANPELHLILLNKDYDSTMNATITINSASNYQSIRVWSFDSLSAAINERLPAPAISGNSFTYAVPKLTACHFMLIPASSVRNNALSVARAGFVCRVVYPYLLCTYSFPCNETGSISLYALNGTLLKHWQSIAGQGTFRLNVKSAGISGKNFLVVCTSSRGRYISKVMLPQ
jgi:mannan endo-1,4-beta-mannosidase